MLTAEQWGKTLTPPASKRAAQRLVQQYADQLGAEQLPGRGQWILPDSAAGIDPRRRMGGLLAKIKRPAAS